MSQQRSHVPKFGNWDSDNIPYTAYFENARKDRGSGVKMNPNDPEENPEAFMFGTLGVRGDGTSHSVQASVSSDKSMSVEKHYPEELKQRTGHRRNASDHQKSWTHRSVTSESGSEKSSSDYSLLQANKGHARAARKKSISESHKSASVPKFGAWDEKDPASGEGFTVIFNKVKEEKHIAATKFPATPPPPNNTSNHKNDTGSKMCIYVFISPMLVYPGAINMAIMIHNTRRSLFLAYGLKS